MQKLDDDKVIYNLERRTPFGGLLRDFNAVVPNGLLMVGDYILNLDNKDTPVDIYVNAEHCSDVLNKIERILTNSTYDSFGHHLNTNAILVVTFSVEGKQKVNVVVVTDLPIYAIESLRFSSEQVWYDGTNVYGNYFKDTFNKKIFILRHYSEEDQETKNKIMGYKNEGFEVKESMNIKPFSSMEICNNSWEKIVVDMAIVKLITKPMQSFNDMNTFRRVMDGIVTEESVADDTICNFSIKHLFHIAARGYTVRNLIHLLGLNSVNLGNLINLLLHNHIHQGDEAAYAILKTMKPYMKSCVYEAYIIMFGTDGYKGNGLRIFNSIKNHSPSESYIPLDVNTVFLFNSDGVDLEEKDILPEPEMYGIVENFRSVGDEYSLPPPCYKIIPNIPYYPPSRTSEPLLTPPSNIFYSLPSSAELDSGSPSYSPVFSDFTGVV